MGDGDDLQFTNTGPVRHQLVLSGEGVLLS
jgi:hypothetical protein